MKKIVIVGGGAGGLELVTFLGKKLGKKQLANITLVDTSLSHLWKPLWHEAAAGTLDNSENEINYLHHAAKNYYTFQLGEMLSINRATKNIQLAAIYDDQGNEVISPREISYDILVIAVGSISNDFSIPGAKEYFFYLDSHAQLEAFQKRFATLLLKFTATSETNSIDFLNITIVGGGATGIELACELLIGSRYAARYQINKQQPLPIKINIIEAAERLAPYLPEKISKVIHKHLTAQGIKIYTNTRIAQVTENSFITATGETIPANLKIWAAGIKAPIFLKNLDGLETNSLNQLVVTQTLQTTIDPNIFAFGDCAYCPQPNTSFKSVPPRAQAAHQQANLLAKSLINQLKNKPLLSFVYRDRGSLISLTNSKAVGHILPRPYTGWFVYGRLARLMYLSLYKLHQIAVYGYWRTLCLSLANFLTRRVKPYLKLH